MRECPEYLVLRSLRGEHVPAGSHLIIVAECLFSPNSVHTVEEAGVRELGAQTHRTPVEMARILIPLGQLLQGIDSLQCRQRGWPADGTSIWLI